MEKEFQKLAIVIVAAILVVCKLATTPKTDRHSDRLQSD
jgi:hypothetical protein